MSAVSEDLVQVTFVFEGGIDVRYLASPPGAGDHVHGLDGHDWLVRGVMEHQGRYLVDCTPLTGRQPAARFAPLPT